MGQRLTIPGGAPPTVAPTNGDAIRSCVMSNIVYYFSGTGNSLAVARDLAHKLGETRIVSVADAIKESAVELPYERIGFVFPVYYVSVPPCSASALRTLFRARVVYADARGAPRQAAGTRRHHRRRKPQGTVYTLSFRNHRPRGRTLVEALRINRCGYPCGSA